MDPLLKSSLKKMAWATLILFAALIGLGMLFASELKSLGGLLVDTFGYPGIGVGILLSDMLTLPIPPDAYLAIAVTADLDPTQVIIWGSAGSILGGTGAYFLGRLLGQTRLVARLVKPFHDKGIAFINRLGVTAVVIAALTPIPFSIICTLAGMVRMRFSHFWPATLFRIPRIGGYYLLIDLGWSFAAAV